MSDDYDEIYLAGIAARQYRRRQLDHTHCADPLHDGCEECEPIEEDEDEDEEGE